MYEQRLDESDFRLTINEEEATHVKILACLRNVPVTIGGMYKLYTMKYDDCAAVEEEIYILDDNGNENFSFWICCKKEFYKVQNTQNNKVVTK